MKTSFFLMVTANGSVRAVKSYRSISWNEVAIEQTVEIPDSIFKKPRISATVTIPPEAGTPSHITAEVAENVKAAIEAASGMQVRITVENPNDETFES